MSSLDRAPAFRAVVLSGAYERVHHALVQAAAAAALGWPTALFFTMSACRAVAVGPGWHALLPSPPHATALVQDTVLARRGVADLETLLAAVASLGGRFWVCEAGLRAENLTDADLRTDLPLVVAGAVTWLTEAPLGGQAAVF